MIGRDKKCVLQNSAYLSLKVPYILLLQGFLYPNDHVQDASVKLIQLRITW